MKELKDNVSMLGTTRLRWENAVLKRKLRQAQAWLTLCALSAIVVIGCAIAVLIAGGAR